MTDAAAVAAAATTTTNLSNSNQTNKDSETTQNHISLENNKIENINNQTVSATNGTNVPVIIVKPGALPTKRNVAVKNTSAAVNPPAKTNKKTNKQTIYKDNDDDDDDDDDEPMNESDREGNIVDYNSNDEYLPPKAGSDGSDVEVSVKRKSARLTKKPKTLDEYDVGESSNDSSFKIKNENIGTNVSSSITSTSNNNTSISQLTQLQELDNNKLPQQPIVRAVKNNEQLNQTNQPNQPKHYARKSTAPGIPPLAASSSNQNYFNNNNNISNQVKTKTSASIKYTAVSASTNVPNQSNPKQPVLTQIANGTHSNSKTDHLNVNSLNATTCSTFTSINPNQPVKQFRNKIISCKPFYESKSTECTPIVKDASTQIDLDEIKLNHTVVPVPVPIHVPVPMCMYQAAMPIPILVPLPIPVPIFIPTTKRTFNRVERKIQKLRKKLPSDPLEFELLLYAEKLAREEGIAGFEESSDGESEPEDDVSKAKKLKSNKYNQENESIQTDTDKQVQSVQQNLMQQNEQESGFKWIYGVRIFNTWLLNKIETHKQKTSLSQRLPDDLLKLKNEELNYLLAEFVHEARKPTGEVYAPESIYYLCLGIQHYLQEKGRVENIFLDYQLFDKFQESLNEIALRYQIRIDSLGHITSRIEEEILWESKQLGAFSPFVLLNTILYFNTKYFFLDKPESHLQLSFTNVKKHSKRNIGPNGEDYGKSVFLRYYPDFHGLEQVIYEQGENYDNPLRCPVELYNFYLSKCPESVKNRSDVFYLLPEKASLPSSPVWFSSQPLSPKMLEKMLNRIKMVKEVNELLIAASPATAATLMQ